MGKAFAPPIPEHLANWIPQQKVFFVATAPRSVHGHVNLSPKSAAQFRIVNDGKSVCYLDFTGSGSETSAHLMDTGGRITVMFVQLEAGAPKIVRLFGKGKIITKDKIPSGILDLFDERDVRDNGFRWIIWIDLHRISSSCGYSVPIYSYVRERETLREVTANLGPDGMETYRAKKNFVSIDYLFCQPDAQKTIPSRIQVEEGFPLCYYESTTSSDNGSWLSWIPSRTYSWLYMRRVVFNLERKAPFLSSDCINGFIAGCTFTTTLGFIALSYARKGRVL